MANSMRTNTVFSTYHISIYARYLFATCTRTHRPNAKLKATKYANGCAGHVWMIGKCRRCCSHWLEHGHIRCICTVGWHKASMNEALRPFRMWIVNVVINASGHTVEFCWPRAKEQCEFSAAIEPIISSNYYDGPFLRSVAKDLGCPQSELRVHPFRGNKSRKINTSKQLSQVKLIGSLWMKNHKTQLAA